MDFTEPVVNDDASILPERAPKSPRISRVKFTPEGDGALLALIRNSTFISHGQVLKLAVNLKIKRHWATVRDRLRIYQDRQMVKVLPPVAPYSGAVYQIAKNGLHALETYGIGIGSITSKTEKLPSELQAHHFLDLNELRLSLYSDRSLSVLQWMTDPEIKDHNTTHSRAPYAKDYDAILELKDNQGRVLKIGIEYERIYKDAARYEKINAEIQREVQLHSILYIASSPTLRAQLVDIFPGDTFPVCVTTASDLRKDRFDAQVFLMIDKQSRHCPFREYLKMLRLPD